MYPLPVYLSNIADLTAARYAAGMMADGLAFVPKADLDSSVQYFESLAGWIQGPEWGLDLRKPLAFNPQDLAGKIPFSFIVAYENQLVTGWQVPVFLVKETGEVIKSDGEEGKYLNLPHLFNEALAEEDFLILECPSENQTGVTDFETLTEFLERLEQVEDI